LKKIAFLFPGQGSQAIGMGLDFYREYDIVRELFDMAEETVKINLNRLCFKGPMEELTLTVNLQPALTVTNLATLLIMEKEGLSPVVSAGHSLGEFSALCAAKVITYEDAIKIVFKRGQLMHREALQHNGSMSAIIGMSIDTVETFVEEVSRDGIVSVANHNTEKQIVITGSPKSVQRVSELVKSNGAKAIPLRVSGAWHSQLMRGAEEEFNDFLQSISFQKPKTPVVHNVTADISDDPNEIRSIIGKQLCNPVKWYDSVQWLIKEEIEIFSEIGPGRVLSGLIKKTVPRDYPCNICNVSSMRNFEQLLKICG
jgi:[acyl-carrier-protein] S-malonyltransferase